MKAKLLFFAVSLAAFLVLNFLFEMYGERTFMLVDDHTIVTSYDEIQQNGYVSFLEDRLKDGERFRPMMGFHHALNIALYGNSITAWKYHYLLLAALAFTCFFYFFRSRNYTFQESLSMNILLFVGMQSVIWWVFDSTENIGVFYLSLALLSIETAIKRHKSYYMLFFWVFIAAASLSKESFIFILPFVAFLYRNKKAVALVLLLLFFSELSIVLTSVGSTFGGYAGVESSSLNLQNCIKIIGQYLIRGYGLPLLLLAGWLFFVNKKMFKQFLFKNGELVVYLLLGVGPFFVLYLKSGLNVGRYLVPLLLPQIIVLVELFRQIKEPLAKKGILVITLLLLGYHVVKLYQIQRDFFTENTQLATFYEAISTQTDENTPITIYADPFLDYEKSGALMIYLRSKNSLNRQKAVLKSLPIENTEAMQKQKAFFDDYYERFGTKDTTEKASAFAITLNTETQKIIIKMKNARIIEVQNGYSLLKKQ